MPDIEFLPDGDENRDEVPRASERDRRRFALRAVGAAVVLTAVVFAVVVRNGSESTPTARPTATPTRPPAAQTSTLALPVSVAFGPASVDVLAVGNRVYSLTPTLIAMAGRDGGAAVVRPAPLGLSAPIGHGELVADLEHHLLWVVDIGGGNAIGAYDLDTLDALSSLVSRYPINGAAAIGRQLWFTTDHGVYTATTKPGAPRLVPNLHRGVWAIAPDPTRRRVLVVTESTPAQLLAVRSHGPVAAVALPISGVTSIGYPTGALWLSGRSADGSLALASVDPSTLHLLGGGASAIAQVASNPRIVGAFQNRVLVRGGSYGQSLYCVDGRTGEIAQQWTVPLGAVSLNETGLLVDAEAGIEDINAHACLSG